MKQTFLDSSYLIALLSKRDRLHARALQMQAHIKGTLLTTEYVLIETLDSLAPVSVRAAAIVTVDRLRATPAVRIIRASDELLQAGIDVFRSRSDKAWGITDCISFVVMEREKAREALTADRHFEQAGFRALLL